MTKDLLDWLAARGWTLANFPWFTYASIGGQARTGPTRPGPSRLAAPPALAAARGKNVARLCARTLVIAPPAPAQVATGTHGSGMNFGSLSDDTQLVALNVILANGTMVQITKWSHPFLWKAMQVCSDVVVPVPTMRSSAAGL